MPARSAPAPFTNPGDVRAAVLSNLLEHQDPAMGFTGMAAGAAVQRPLNAGVTADTRLAAVPMATLPTGGGGPSQTCALPGDLSAQANFGNTDIYPRHSRPAPYAVPPPNIARQTAAMVAGLPAVIIRVGYYTNRR